MNIVEIDVGQNYAQFEIENVQSGDDLNFVAVGGGETKTPVIEHEEGWTWASVFFGRETGGDDLVPGTTYILQNNSGVTFEFTTMADPQKTATQSQWQDLAYRIKQAKEIFYIGDLENVDFNDIKNAIEANKKIIINPGSMDTTFAPLDLVDVIAQERNDIDDIDTCILWTIMPKAAYVDDPNAKMVTRRYYFTAEERGYFDIEF